MINRIGRRKEEERKVRCAANTDYRTARQLAYQEVPSDHSSNISWALESLGTWN
ncbi:hypothetical protein CY34DRAFT_809228 [Suillus luteus UH-Slu-Lm8-n1]|uniref:Uncharacterized protein n=1 Tax=Suillus luteus UH-Slu-Lm8-n1 TaxID=930992 RepID=A0A0D0AW30_9AGAM|nr:hypothetical protein CY34DRAFT_809228 [Suillus luteus UH-Slu-Lm8-n1]